MGQVKKALLDAECSGYIHPVIAQTLRAFRPYQTELEEQQPDHEQQQPNHEQQQLSQPQVQTVYGLYANGCLLAVYQHKTTAEYECWVSRVGEEVSHAETLTQYEVQPIPMHTHITE